MPHAAAIERVASIIYSCSTPAEADQNSGAGRRREGLTGELELARVDLDEVLAHRRRRFLKHAGYTTTTGARAAAH
jgi:hypothetical protein